MNRDYPIYTVPNECQDCYKCVRHCPCKAIRIVNARAAVIPELCVSCGVCVKVCPAHAKKVRSDLDRAKFLLANDGRKVYASIAPSYLSYFKGIKLEQLATALKQLGFAGVSETAIGAQIVSSATGSFLKNADSGAYISSACPGVVGYIEKYLPEWAAFITPVASPVIAHARYLRQVYGDDICVIFIGPCAAKKLESDQLSNDLQVAITFAALEHWLEEKSIELNSLDASSVIPASAEEGRSYALEGGMNDTLREPNSGIRYVAVSGLAEVGRMLRGITPKDIRAKGTKLFIEALACPGGCVNGPVMPKRSATANLILETLTSGSERTSINREVPVPLGIRFKPDLPQIQTVSEEAITKALAEVGKFTLSDELNCGGCGYNSCRSFAQAMVTGKAEPSMCVSWLRKIARKTNVALIKYIPAGVVLANEKLEIVECNRHFAELCGNAALEAFNACGNLAGANLQTFLEDTTLFEEVLSAGGEVVRPNQVVGERIFNISVFAVTQGRTVGAVIQDVTSNELHREQIAEKAREVIRKNVLTVQSVARALGEHMAETEILLNEVAGAYSQAGARHER